mgnify:CR=1 FL=1
MPEPNEPHPCKVGVSKCELKKKRYKSVLGEGVQKARAG